MEDGDKHLCSAAAFVAGGVQDACDDSCSICLEPFCDSDPSTVTVCKHEFHLQCILEWGQRSSQCPMCWQPLSLKDLNSQELFDAVEQERNMRMNPPRNTTIFHHPALGDFELQHLPVSATDSDLEERIIQHLAAAAAMGRARNLVRRESQRPRTSTQVAEGSAQLITTPLPSQMNQNPAAGLGGSGGVNLVGSSPNSRSPPSSPSNQDGVGPSDFQSLSESIKSRFSAMSMRYKESITKSTRGWKERLFSRNNNNNSTEGRNEAGTDAPTVSHVISNGMDGNMTPDSAGHRQISAVDGNHSLTQGHRENPYTAGSVSD